MVVDDSSVVRHLLSALLRSEPDLEVVGTASNGREALDRIEVYRPHVVVLDLEMPVLDGLETLRELRQLWPKLAVIMFSTLTERGAAATLDALAHGANDYVTKPSNTGALASSLDVVRQHLVPLVRTWGGIGRRRDQLAQAGDSNGRLGAVAATQGSGPVSPVDRGAPSVPVTLRAPTYRSKVDAVVIGSSTGGPNALAELMPRLPGDLGVPLLLVQHMPEIFTRILAERLDAKCSLTVVEAEPDMVVTPNYLYVARGGVHLVVKRHRADVVVAYDDGPPENSCKPSVDTLFRSAVQVWGGGLLGVVLTGMGYDGLAGSRAIDAAGGAVVTQDEASSVVWGMPGAVSTAGLSSENLPLDKIATAIVHRVRSPNAVSSPK